MQVTVPDEIAAALTEQEVLLDFAIGLYVQEHATMGQASGLAGISVPEFQMQLGKRGICVHYGEEDLANDMLAVEKLARR